jgi:hypothetical protein
MRTICDADLQFLKPGKRVILKSFNGSLVAPQDVKPEKNYWLLIGSKAETVKRSEDNQCVLLRFEKSLMMMGLDACKGEENALWVSINDLKFVCRY